MYAFIIFLKQLFNIWNISIIKINTTLINMKIKAEYIWIDGQTPTAYLRSKTKVMEQGIEPPLWGFDGSSTQQATGDQSDCVLRPVATLKTH
jgi:hypothetical protein